MCVLTEAVAELSGVLEWYAAPLTSTLPPPVWHTFAHPSSAAPLGTPHHTHTISFSFPLLDVWQSAPAHTSASQHLLMRLPVSTCSQVLACPHTGVAR